MPIAVQSEHLRASRAAGQPNSTVLNRCRNVLIARAASQPSFAIYTHLLLLDSLGNSDSSEQAGPKVLSILTDDQLLKAHLGRSGLIRTVHGVAYQSTEAGGESHRDQVLAAFAHRGVPLDSPITVAGQRFAVRDLFERVDRRFSFETSRTRVDRRCLRVLPR
jgi:hypothetical protein